MITATSTPTATPAGESILDRLRQRGPAAMGPLTQSSSAGESSSAGTDDDSPFDLGTFGWLRGVKDHALMLELRLRSGNVIAVSYAYVERAEYDPSEGITLHLGGGKVARIEGANLNAPTATGVRLFDGIVRRRVPWVGESTDSGRSDRQSCRVEQIHV
jgi:hypothetical protein